MTNYPRILVLDIGLSAEPPLLKAGQVLELNPNDNTKQLRALVPSQVLPDGIAVDSASQRMFWTCMGFPGKWDGAVYSSALDGTDVRTLVAPGKVNTPKQLTLDETAKKVYFCDREGLGVYRCNFDGSELEALILNGEPTTPPDESAWCVGITVAPSLGKFFWTQKGYSKSGKGRIFSANINTPFGNSLNRARLDESVMPKTIMTASASFTAEVQERKYEILTRNLNEAIGLKLDVERGHVYLTDLGGSVYRCDLEGKSKERLYHEDSRAFTGIALL